jgi:hypothetical protein
MRRFSLPAMTARSGPKQCSQNIQKNRSRTTVAERIGATLAELPFTGDKVVCLGHDPGRLERTCINEAVNKSAFCRFLTEG